MTKGLLLPAFLALVLIAPLSAGAAEQSALAAGEKRQVEKVIDGDTLVLDQPVDGAREVRLVGLQAPKLPLGRPNFPTWPLAEDAKRALEGLTLHRQVTLSYGGERMDRNRRRLAHLHLDDGTWVQGAMLKAGMARVDTFADNRALAAEMLALEAEARAARGGIWADPFYAIRSVNNLARDIDSFQVVGGKVLDAAKVKTRVYLNFGTDWRSDFTASIDARALRLFARSGPDPLALEGKTVRVRGWLRPVNGPLIDVTHPEQVEVLDR
jgi:micrococcal nuclease